MADAEKPIHRGNQAFIDEDYPTTLQAYGEAVSLGGVDEALARSNRAAVYLKLGKYTEALQDVSAAVKLMPTEIALYRKGLAAFALEEFETALEAFRRGQAFKDTDSDNQKEKETAGGSSDPDPRKYRTWIRKCEAELEAEEEAAAAAAPVEEPPTKVPRPYSSTKNWDVVEREVQKELDSEKPEGEQALNDLFKSIYGKADEDTRRAMVKSFQTSGGTVLSTNWDEVGKADYEKERQAPKGMEWKTWEGAKLPQKDDDDN